MSKKKQVPSWERGEYAADSPHSPSGIATLRRTLKDGLCRLYGGIAESMWRYDGIYEDERFKSMLEMGRDIVPERFMYANGAVVWFEYAGQIQCLPYVMDSSGLNIYGNPVRWSPIPIGWSDNVRGKSVVADEIRDLKLTWEDSVLMQNDYFRSSEQDYVAQLVTELVDNTLTMNQLQLLAKAVMMFSVSDDNMLTAKNIFAAIANDSPAIFTNRFGESADPVILNTGMQIDEALFELYDRFECQLLEYIGFPCVPITKRAQQSVSEVESHEMKVYARRQEKLRMRERAVERINALWGTNIKVVSVVDERKEEILAMGQEAQDPNDDRTEEVDG